MSERSSRPDSAQLPVDPSLEWLRKQAKRRLDELQLTDPSAKLASAQLALAREYGFPSWRALKAHVDSLSVDGRLVAAAKEGDLAALEALLREHPDRLHVRTEPYEWTLLHVAADAGQVAVVDVLLRRGLDVDARERGDNTTALHWAAAGGHLDVVRRLVDAGADAVGRGDEHELEVIGWATCWDGCDDHAHRAIVRLLLQHGARHHVFSAIAMNLGHEVRRIAAADPAAVERPMSRHEQRRRPLHFAVRTNRPEMVALLLDLGADPAATDAVGIPAAVYAAQPEVGEEVIRILADRAALGLFGALALRDFETAARLFAESGGDTARDGVLHLLAKRGDADAVRWLLERGADPNARWAHWDAEVTPLHLAAAEGNVEVVRLLLDAGADPSVRDSKHDGDAVGWAQHGRTPPSRRADEVVAVLREIEESLL